MAGPSDPWPLWAQEASGTSGGPTIARVLAAAALVAALVLAAQPATDSGQVSTRLTVSPACAELARLRSHGVTSGPWVARVRVACTRSTQQR